MSKDKPRFEVEILYPEESEVYLILGISEERSDEIANIAKQCYKDNQLFTETIKATIEQMDNVNEVVFATLCLARSHDKGDDLLGKLELLKILMKLKS